MLRSVPAFALFATLAFPVLLASPARGQENQAADSGGSAATPRPSERPSEIVREIQSSVSRVQHLLAETRRAGRVQPASCVDATLSQVSATLRLAMERSQRVQRYERQRDPVAAERELALIARLLPRARDLEREARRCVDPDLDMTPGRTRITTVIDPRVPRDAVQPSDRRSGAVYE